MTALLEKITYYFAFPFVYRALIVGVLIALCSALLGVTLVLKRFSFIGDGLSHVAFGALSVSAVVGISNEMTVVLPITVLCAILILCSKRGSKIKGDAAIAMLSVSALAIGYLLMNVFPVNSGNISGDVCTTLFGSTSILTLTKTEVTMCVILSALVVILYVLFYNKIFSITFDEDFSKATGMRVGLYNLLLATVISVVVVLAMNLVGSLLISALVVFPALSAMRICKSFKGVTVTAAIILISVIGGTPVGSTVVIAQLLVFILFSIASALNKR